MTLPVGTIITYHWDSITSGVSNSAKRAELRSQGWEFCDGGVVENKASPIHGHKKPNLNQYRLPLGTPFDTGVMNPSSNKPNEARHVDGAVRINISSEIRSELKDCDGTGSLHQNSTCADVSYGLNQGDGGRVAGGSLNVTIDATPPFTTVWYLIKVLP